MAKEYVTITLTTRQARWLRSILAAGDGRRHCLAIWKMVNARLREIEAKKDPPMSERDAREQARRDSRLPCDCIDCDGEFSAWCMDHHGKKECPIVSDWKAEECVG